MDAYTVVYVKEKDHSLILGHLCKNAHGDFGEILDIDFDGPDAIPYTADSRF